MSLRALPPSIALCSVLLSGSLRAQGTPLGFEEEFALATDRAAALEKLVPGTQDYYYYHSLHAQNEGRLGEVPALLDAWTERHKGNVDQSRMEVIRVRQALLSYDRDPDATFQFLLQRLHPALNHEREVPGQVPDLPTRLDPRLVSLEAFTAQALASNPGTVAGFQSSAFDFLLQSGLEKDRLSDLLGRLDHPDFRNLVPLLAADLERRESGGFGSRNVHRVLFQDQLEELVRLRPALLGDAQFLQVYVQRLLPGADTDWTADAAAREAYLERLQAFADRLPPAMNSFKAHVLYHRLVHDLGRGVFDRDRFRTYLRLPRPVPYAKREWLSGARQDLVADLGFDPGTGLAAIRNDEALVQTYLDHFFATDSTIDSFRDWVDQRYLERRFAETKILLGVEPMERWYSLLDDPGYYERLEKRVELDFAATLPTVWPVDRPVVLDLDVKNVPQLLVKVFEIDAFRYGIETGREVDASIDLDGLVANHEHRFDYDSVPLRRVRRQYEFPEIQGPGTFVIDFIGNGLSSRAVIQRGSLQARTRTGSAGLVVQVLDEAGRWQKEARAWIQGSEFHTDADGDILVPFSTDPGSRALVLESGGRTAVQSVYHPAEVYELGAGIHVDREALLAGRKAQIVVRPSLSGPGGPLAIALLEDAVLRLQSVDLEGHPSQLDVRGFELFDDREAVREIDVPNGLRQLSVQLLGKVKELSTGQKRELASPTETFSVNEIDTTAWTFAPLVSRHGDEWVLDVLGKNGEAIADRAVALRLRHRHFVQPLDVTLKTDAAGRIRLGELDGIVALELPGFPAGANFFSLVQDERTVPALAHGRAGETLRFALPAGVGALDHSWVSLIELRGNNFARDAFDRLAVANGYLELRGLPAGDYQLRFSREQRSVRVRIADGTEADGWITGTRRALERTDPTPLQVTALEAKDDALLVQLAGFGPETRVHVVADRYLPAFPGFPRLSVGTDQSLRAFDLSRSSSQYAAGREIGDEYRYILERRYAKKFPGNMLPRPSLLLNPWALEETDSVIGTGGGAGGGFGGKYGRRGGAAEGLSRQESLGDLANGNFANLDFLADVPHRAINLRPAEDGTIRVPWTELGTGGIVQVIAVDASNAVAKTLYRAESPLARRDRSLVRALPPEQHVSEQREVEYVATGASVTVEDLLTARLETFDTLGSVHRLLLGLSGNTDLARFSFVTRWPSLSFEEKSAFYSEFACHELHFFLFQKDREFFDAVVRPYLVQKMDKTFLDQWLLGEDLRAYLEPWSFERLNVVEKILLARRIREERPALARFVKEQYEQLPQDVSRYANLFGAVFEANALDGKESLGKKLEEEARVRLQALGYLDEAEVAADAAPAPEVTGSAGFLLGRGAEKRKAANKDAVLRDAYKSLYRGPDATRAWVEHNYWHRRIEEQNESLVTVNGFWADFAASPEGAPFVSDHLAEPTSSLTEAMFALSVLDLPFEAGEHATQTDGGRFTLTAAGPMILVRRELRPCAMAAGVSPVLVQQNFFRPDDRYRFDGNRRLDRFVEGEFLVGTVYGCQVVVTNPSSSPRSLELLLQVPAGAMPVLSGFQTRSVPVQLGPYATTTYEYQFYFPATGARRQFPVHVTADGELVAFTEAPKLEVVQELSQVDTTSWTYVSQNAELGALLEFLDQHNVQRLDLGKIAWRMKDKAAFAAITARLSARHVYADTLWAYALRHRDPARTREFLDHASAVVDWAGYTLDTPLLRVDPIARRSYQHVEFDPLIHERAHRFGPQRRIFDQGLAQQYRSLLDLLAQLPKLGDEEWLSVTYYLLLQDRVEEALATFAKVRPDALPTRIQYDYFAAYLDFFSDAPSVARSISDRYRDFPVKRWNDRFAEIRAQLAEIDGSAAPGAGATDDRTRQLTGLAAQEPSIELSLEAQKLVLRHQNLGQCEVRYYAMDVEFLFSNSPFVQQGSGSFAFVRPNRLDVVRFAEGTTETRLDLPEEFKGANVLVEVRAAGQVRRQTYLSTKLAVQVVESYGQLRVTDAESGAAVPRTYVKVYARTADGTVRFHKDGYTDLRGRFDYASVSGSGREPAERYALLILSEDGGAVIREVAPPLR